MSVPADCRLSPASSPAVSVDQSALTGESSPTTLRPGDVVLAGSVCERGEARAVVTHTVSEVVLGCEPGLIYISMG